MILPISITVISFLLDGLFSLIIPFDSIFMFKSFFTLMSLIVLFPYFVYRERQYYILSFVTGLLYDLIYTNTLLLNALLFLSTAILIRYIYKEIQNNIANGVVISVLILFIYNTLTYVILNIIGVTTTPYSIFLSHLIFIDIINVLYFVITYIIARRIADTIKLRYIDK